MIDMRSDTVTRPTPEMRAVMASAEVGDDVYGEDPTVAALERKVADLLGKETALFVPSGTMANQIALLLHCRPGDAVFCGARTHIGRYESGAAGGAAGVQLFETQDSVFPPEQLESILLPDAFYYPRSRLLVMENTHNDSGGRLFRRDWFEANASLAREQGLSVHLDGARLWNASIAMDLPLDVLAKAADTVSICFSKGLGAPMGSALAMNADRRKEALRYRRRMGGALRQAGIVAAGAIYAIDQHFKDLKTDHRRAHHFATLLSEGGVSCDPSVVETNIIMFDVADASALVEVLGDRVALGAISATRVRAVTHRDLSDDSVENAAKAIIQACG